MWGKVCDLANHIADVGSTPRMWGKGTQNEKANKQPRFNPTHVGKSRPRIYLIEHSPVQPHACGEKPFLTLFHLGSPGSTPRMWGKGQPAVLLSRLKRFNPTHVGKSSGRCPLRLRVRFNPTHVGKSLLNLHSSPFSSVQPHACGEKFLRVS